MGMFIDTLKKGKVISIVVDGDYIKDIEYKDGKIMCTGQVVHDLPFEVEKKELTTEFDVVNEISDNYWVLLDSDFYE